MKFFIHFSKSLLSLAVMAAVFAGCKDDDTPVHPDAITITGMDPISGPVGTEVRVTGNNFDETRDDHIFHFHGGRQAEITQLTDGQFMVVVPSGATTGSVSLTVNGQTISGPTFTVTEPETGITALRPRQIAEGMKVRIIGHNFGNAVTDHVVTFNDTEATISSISDKQIIAEVPGNITNGRVRLSMGGETYEGPEYTVLDDQEINFSDGFNRDAGFATIGEAFVYEDGGIDGSTAIRLTPAKADRVGLAYYGTRIPLENGFETTFEFRISRPGRPAGQTGEIGAEGLAFVIHNDPAGLEARGHRGGSLGYAGIHNGLAVEFDVYNNQAGEHPMQDPNGNHISIQTNTRPAEQFGRIGAEIYHSLGYTTAETNPDLPDFIGNESSRNTAKIVYTPGLMQVFVNDMDTPALEVELTLTDYMQFVDGRAYVGFTATTGVSWGWAAHDILSWRLDPATGNTGGEE